jgi:Calcineurin-like phosphoesterase
MDPASAPDLWNNRLVQPVAILGDIHGDSERMLEIVDGLDPTMRLVVVGDYFDRWNQAMEAVHWLMERPNTTALMGNHDALILGVVEEALRGEEGRNTENWLWNGGDRGDLKRLMAEPAAIEWLRQLPAMVLIGDTLVQHSDSPVYLFYGDSVDAVNDAFRALVQGRDPDVLLALFADLCRRREFYAVGALRDYLKVFQAKRLVHGHTPHTQPRAISMFGGAIVNVDGALSRGFGPGPRGFIHWLDGDDADAQDNP